MQVVTADGPNLAMSVLHREQHGGASKKDPKDPNISLGGKGDWRGIKQSTREKEAKLKTIY